MIAKQTISRSAVTQCERACINHHPSQTYVLASLGLEIFVRFDGRLNHDFNRYRYVEPPMISRSRSGQIPLFILFFSNLHIASAA